MDLETCRTLNDWLERLDLPPDITERWAEAAEGQEGYTLAMCSNLIPDSTKIGTVQGGVTVDLPVVPHSPHELALDVAAALVARAVHEAFEWIRVDGERIGQPHAGDEDLLWSWMMTSARFLVDEYVNLFGKPTEWVQVTDWNGKLVYNGPAPVPPGTAELSPADMQAGRAYCFEVIPLEWGKF